MTDSSPTGGNHSHGDEVGLHSPPPLWYCFSKVPQHHVEWPTYYIFFFLCFWNKDLCLSGDLFLLFPTLLLFCGASGVIKGTVPRADELCCRNLVSSTFQRQEVWHRSGEPND